MRWLVFVGFAACSSPPQPKRPDFPIEPPPSDAGPREELAYQPIGEPSMPTTMPKVGDRMPAAGSTSIASTNCIPAGLYNVSVDLSAAHLSQNNTGMSDLTWCKSMLEAIPKASMATMRIAIVGGRDGPMMSIEWPPGQPSRLSPGGDCSFVITSPPMVSSITFENGKGSGTASYAVGTQNHPDESCSAAGAVLTITPAK